MTDEPKFIGRRPGDAVLRRVVAYLHHIGLERQDPKC
jgi:hypothetical protein